MTALRILVMVVAPLLILAAGALGASYLVSTRPEVSESRPEVPPPLVRTVEARAEAVQLTVEAQGTVQPRTQTRLVPEVSGRVIALSPNLESGGFFEEGEVLLTLDPRDYQLALAQAELDLARAAEELAIEEADAEVARREWRELGVGEPGPLTLREPQLETRRAAVESARARLELAERDLERTRLRAPFAGRVRDERVDPGQFVSRGETVAELYAVDWAEVRLPLADAELEFLRLPLGYRGEHPEAGGREGGGPEVELSASFAGREHRWSARIVRTEGELDPKSRMVIAIARVEDPYGRSEDFDRPPLMVGMFVRAEVLGRTLDDAVVLPRSALRSGSEVWLVDAQDRLRRAPVRVARTDRDTVVVAEGIRTGDRVVVSALDAVADGMPVRVEERAGRGEGAGDGEEGR